MSTFRPGGLSERAAREANEQERWREAMRHPIVTGAFGMTFGADGRPIIYGLTATAADSPGSLVVCGSPIHPRNVIPGDVTCPECDIHDADVRRHPDVRALYFEKCDFQVFQTDHCSGSGAGDSGSGSSGNGPETLAIKLTGKTESVEVLRGVECCDDGNLLEKHKILCFRNGLYIGNFDVPDEECPA